MQLKQWRHCMYVNQCRSHSVCQGKLRHSVCEGKLRQALQPWGTLLMYSTAPPSGVLRYAAGGLQVHSWGPLGTLRLASATPSGVLRPAGRPLETLWLRAHTLLQQSVCPIDAVR